MKREHSTVINKSGKEIVISKRKYSRFNRLETYLYDNIESILENSSEPTLNGLREEIFSKVKKETNYKFNSRGVRIEHRKYSSTMRKLEFKYKLSVISVTNDNEIISIYAGETKEFPKLNKRELFQEIEKTVHSKQIRKVCRHIVNFIEEKQYRRDFQTDVDSMQFYPEGYYFESIGIYSWASKSEVNIAIEVLIDLNVLERKYKPFKLSKEYFTKEAVEEFNNNPKFMWINPQTGEEISGDDIDVCIVQKSEIPIPRCMSGRYSGTADFQLKLLRGLETNISTILFDESVNYKNVLPLILGEKYSEEEKERCIEHCDWLGIDPFGVEFKKIEWK